MSSEIFNDLHMNGIIGSYIKVISPVADGKNSLITSECCYPIATYILKGKNNAGVIEYDED